MKIGNFNISKKIIIIVVGIIALIIISSLVSKHNREKEIARRSQEADSNVVDDGDTEATTEYDYDAAEQANLREKFGEPPEGFEWDLLGNLVATGRTGNETAEDIVYIYIRALSILDFSTAQRYSSTSKVTDTYNGYYDEYSTIITDYYQNFRRKQYKEALQSIELLNVTDTAVFADGTEMVTLKIRMLDLTDKDFWRADQDNLYNQLREYDNIEADAVKRDQFIYDYIYNAYKTGMVKKRDIDIEIVVAKENNSGWLVKDDTELDAALSYEWGNDIATYIQSEYQDWKLEKDIDEMYSAPEEEVTEASKTDASTEAITEATTEEK